MSEISSGLRLYTIGKLTERLQLPHRWIEFAIEELGLKPFLTLNDLNYFTPDDENKIYEFYRQKALKRIENAKR